MRSFIRLPRVVANPRARVAGVVALAVIALVAQSIVTRQQARAQDPPGWAPGGSPGYQFGDPLRQPLPVPSAAVDTVTSRAAAVGAALGLRGSPGPVAHGRDAWNDRIVDEVSLVAADGSDTATITLDESGLPLVVVRFDRPRDSEAAKGTGASAPTAALRHLAALRLATPPGRPRLEWDAGLQSWSVAWDRTIDGFAVPGDGLFVNVTSGGEFVGMSRWETPHAAAPANRIAPARAREIAMGWATQRDLPSFQGFRAERPRLEWRQANDFVEPAKPDAPEPLLRLVYAIRFSYVPRGEETPMLVDLFVDAGDGSIIGGATTA
jgi:hypothetical protein